MGRKARIDHIESGPPRKPDDPAEWKRSSPGCSPNGRSQAAFWLGQARTRYWCGPGSATHDRRSLHCRNRNDPAVRPGRITWHRYVGSSFHPSLPRRSRMTGVFTILIRQAGDARRWRKGLLQVELMPANHPLDCSLVTGGAPADAAPKSFFCCAPVRPCYRRILDTNGQEKTSCSGRCVSRSPESRSGRFVFRTPRVGRSRSILGLPPWMLIGTVLTRLGYQIREFVEVSTIA
jgi:hypothetical protein